MALRLQGNLPDAEDAVQDATLLALPYLDQFRAEGKMSTCLNGDRDQFRTQEVASKFKPVQAILDEHMASKTFCSQGCWRTTVQALEEVCRKLELAETLAHATTPLPPILRRTFQLSDPQHGAVYDASKPRLELRQLT